MIAYIGGKYRQAKWIESFMPTEFKIYVEVFGGAFWNYIKGSFDCDIAVYNDVNRFMANLFACCTEYENFIDHIKNVEPQQQHIFNEYKRDILEILNNNIEFEIPNFHIGSKYVYLVTQIFSGIMSDKAKMVDLKGKYKSKYLSFAGRLENPKIQRRLDYVKVSNLSYELLIPQVDGENTFIYLDPPYYGTENLYAFHNFTIENHIHLANMLKSCKSKWMLSYYDFPELSKWFPEDKYRWERKDFKKASMATEGKGQSVGTEVLVMNY